MSGELRKFIDKVKDFTATICENFRGADDELKKINEELVKINKMYDDIIGSQNMTTSYEANYAKKDILRRFIKRGEFDTVDEIIYFVPVIKNILRDMEERYYATYHRGRDNTTLGPI